MADIETLVRQCYGAYETKSRETIERLVGEPFSFTSPYDDHIDRKTYFERCWPNADRMTAIRIEKLFVEGDEAFVRYEVTPKTGKPFHNTEFLRFQDGKLREVEVFFGEVNGVEQKP